MGGAGLPKKGPKKRAPPDVFLAPFWFPWAALGESNDDLGVPTGALLGVSLGVHMQNSKLRSRVDENALFKVCAASEYLKIETKSQVGSYLW